MPNMSRPVQQRRPVERQPAEYAAKADVEVLAAEIRGLREAVDARFEKVEAEIRGLRESVEARFEKVEAEIRGLRESVDARLAAIERQIERMAADHRATVRWIVGSAVALAGLMVAMLRFGQTGGG